MTSGHNHRQSKCEEKIKVQVHLLDYYQLFNVSIMQVPYLQYSKQRSYQCECSTQLRLRMIDFLLLRTLIADILPPLRIWLSDIPGTRREVGIIQSGQVLALRWLPLCAVPWLDSVNVHGIDLLEASSLTLTDEKVYNNKGRETAGSKDIAIAVVNCAGDVRRKERDAKVPNPVGRSS